MSINWIEIKNEYINTKISQRKLAEKYGVSFNSLKDKANKEQWFKDKKKQHNKIATKTQQKTEEKIVKAEVDRIGVILGLWDKIAQKIDKAIEQVESDDGSIDTYKLRQVVQSAKDLIGIVKTGKNDDKELRKLDEVLDKIEGNI